MNKGQQSALRIYVKAALWALPFATAWVFSSVILMPAVEDLWMRSGTQSSRVSAIISVSSASLNHGKLILGGLILGIVGLEAWASWWPARRKIVIESLTFVFTLAVLVLVLAVSTAAIVVARLHTAE
jgi:hypothetical protein